VKTVGVRPAEWQQKKKFIFFLRSFPERMFREVNGVLIHVHAARDHETDKTRLI
jgi:hypothetical protein